MRRRLATAAVLALGVWAAPARADDARIVSERPLPDRGVELTIATSAFTAPTRVQVFLPAGYDADRARRWPVAYYLHGAQGDEKRFHEWYGDLIRDFPAIFVAPAGGAVGFYSDWFNNGAGGPPEFETYDIEQLLPLIDAHFRTTASRAGRVLIGESMGGYGVMTYASRHPDLFAASASLSGFLDSNYTPAQAVISGGPLAMGGQPDDIYGPRTTQEIRWHGHNPTDLAANLRDVDLQVRTAEGYPNQEIEGPAPTPSDCVLEKAIFQTSTDFHVHLAALGIPHVWHDYGAGCHTIPTFRREFADALPGLARALAHPRPAPRAFDYRSIEPHFAIWGWRVDADAQRALEFLALRDAGRAGVTLAGSGTTTVTTPPYFRGLRAVDAGGRVLAPDRAGRLRFTVDLGAAHREQQAGDVAAGYFNERTVRFAPHARLLIHRSRGRACVRSLGPAVHRIRITVAHRRHAARCVRLARRRAAVRATATDAYGHRVSVSDA